MITQIVDNFSNSIVDTVETAFTAEVDTMIGSFTVSNNSGVNASYTASIVSATGDNNPQIPFKIVVWGRNDLGIGIVNQVIPAGGTLKFSSSALDSLYFTVTGRTF